MLKTKEQKLNNEMQENPERTVRKCLVSVQGIYNKGITLIALVITIVLNCSFLAMVEMNK